MFPPSSWLFCGNGGSGIWVNADVVFRGVDFDDEEYGLVEEGKGPKKVGSFLLSFLGIAESGAGGLFC